MVKALIVDDEPVVCEGIQDFLLEANLGIDEVIVAYNGFEALDYVRMENVDFIMTDIQMGGMNGIELMQAVKLEYPDIPIVVISAHDEFEYAQKSMRLGAKDYLIKPVSLDKMIEVVTGLKSKLKESSERHLRQKWFLQEHSSLKSLVLNQMVTDDRFDSAQFKSVLQSLEVPLEGPYFCMMAFKPEFGSAGRDGEEIASLTDKNRLRYACLNVIEESLQNWNGTAFLTGGGMICAILQWGSQPSDKLMEADIPQLNLLGETVHANISRYLQLECKIGISRVHATLEELSAMYAEAAEALRWNRTFRTGAVLFYDDFKFYRTRDHDSIETELDELVARFKFDRDPAACDREIEQFLDGIASIFADADAYTHYALTIGYKVYQLVYECKDEADLKHEQFLPSNAFPFPIVMDERRRRLESYLKAAAQWVRDHMAQRDNKMAKLSLLYIEEHYRQKGLKVQDIANAVFLSPSYLGYLFKKTVGVNVWDYVTKLRMEEAKRLLLTTEMKRYEIADEVGYESPEHFSRIFKKYFGASPLEFRK